MPIAPERNCFLRIAEAAADIRGIPPQRALKAIGSPPEYDDCADHADAVRRADARYGGVSCALRAHLRARVAQRALRPVKRPKAGDIALLDAYTLGLLGEDGQWRFLDGDVARRWEARRRSPKRVFRIKGI